MSQENEKDPSRPYRCGYVALAGKPNVGKSTLLNALVGEHLSIVTSKAQTTRERVAGIVTTEAFQVLFVDAPGLIEPRYALQDAMHLAATAALEEADVIAYVGDATRPGTLPDAATASAIAERSVPVLVLINKCDVIDEARKTELVTRAEAWEFETLAVSARTGWGLREFMERVAALLPASPPLFPAEDTATQPLRFFVREFVRETCLELFRDEVPYSVACSVDEFREEQDPIFIRVVIYVERESQKGILIGKGGASIRKVGEVSRRKMEALLGGHVYLELRVKVIPGWRRKRVQLKQLGFQLP